MKRTVLVIFYALFFISCAAKVSMEEIRKADYGRYPENYKQIIKNVMDKQLFDPYSAVYRWSTTPQKGYAKLGGFGTGETYFGYVVSVGINAKNRLGGYTGEQIYFFLFSRGKLYDVTDRVGYGYVNLVE